MPGPTLLGEGSIIVMSTIGVALYSARQLTQTLSPIAAASVVRRSINMTARSIALAAAKKYNSEISAAGEFNMEPPSFDAIWPGLEVVIDCVVELSRPVASSASRPVVSGSEVTIGNFVRYRPQITFIVVNLSLAKEEWTAGHPWTLSLTEK